MRPSATGATTSPRSSRSPPSRPAPRCVTPRGCWATPMPWATGWPRRCHRWSWGVTRRSTPASNPTRSSRTATRSPPSCARCTRPIPSKPENGQPLEEAPVVTQYEMHGVEELGLLKMDFLGLRNLDVISDTVEIIRRTRGIELDIDAVPLDDELTYEMLRRGESIGVFQLEGGPMRALMRSLAPTGFEDIAALNALYRPGPMAANMHNDYADRKNGRKPVNYLHPDAEEVLGDTWGLMVYQESMMRIAQRFAGYSLADADNLRKACSKKDRRLIAEERAKFIEGCKRSGFGQELGSKWFNIIEPFADYAFNKSHAYGYGYVAYQTAYLKANYPAEYFSALLTS